MQSYFSYAAEYGFFDDDKIISKKVIEYGDKKVGFVFCNTALCLYLMVMQKIRGIIICLIWN